MKEVGLNPSHRIPEPNTWRELLTYIDAHVPISNLTVGLQEYGKSNPSLPAGLEARGARVERLRVYQYDLPEDTTPLEANLRAIAAQERDVALFTSAHQVVNCLLLADRLGIEREVRNGFRRMAVCSVGPTTSETLREHDLQVDLEPAHPKMGPLVLARAEGASEILRKKRRSAASARDDRTSDSQAPWYDSPFMKACRREPCDVTPWLMRQAGRYMEE